MKSPDRTEFTYWPHPGEAAGVATSTADAIGAGIHEDPDLFVPFLHELWRTNQPKKMFDTLNIIRIDHQMDPVSMMKDSSAMHIVFMCLQHGESTQTVRDFLKETIEIIFKAAYGMDYTEQLPEELRQQINTYAIETIAPITEHVRQIRSRFN